MKNLSMMIVLIAVSASCGNQPSFSLLKDDAGAGDTTTSSDTDTGAGDSDTFDDEDTGTDTGTDTDTDTDTEVDECPWGCASHVCDIWDPVDLVDFVHNWDLDHYCDNGMICCQPIDATNPGAWTTYCKDAGDTFCHVEKENDPCLNPYPAYCYTSENRCCQS